MAGLGVGVPKKNNQQDQVQILTSPPQGIQRNLALGEEGLSLAVADTVSAPGYIIDMGNTAFGWASGIVTGKEHKYDGSAGDFMRNGYLGMSSWYDNMMGIGPVQDKTRGERAAVTGIEVVGDVASFAITPGATFARGAATLARARTATAAIEFGKVAQTGEKLSGDAIRALLNGSARDAATGGVLRLDERAMRLAETGNADKATRLVAKSLVNGVTTEIPLTTRLPSIVARDLAAARNTQNSTGLTGFFTRQFDKAGARTAYITNYPLSAAIPQAVIGPVSTVSRIAINNKFKTAAAVIGVDYFSGGRLHQAASPLLSMFGYAAQKGISNGTGAIAADMDPGLPKTIVQAVSNVTAPSDKPIGPNDDGSFFKQLSELALEHPFMAAGLILGAIQGDGISGMMKNAALFIGLGYLAEQLMGGSEKAKGLTLQAGGAIANGLTSAFSGAGLKGFMEAVIPNPTPALQWRHQPVYAPA